MAAKTTDPAVASIRELLQDLMAARERLDKLEDQMESVREEAKVLRKERERLIFVIRSLIADIQKQQGRLFSILGK